MATTLPVITSDQFAQRLLANFPTPWASDEARQPGGVLYALAKTIADQLEVLLGDEQFIMTELYTLLQTFPQLALINQSACTRQALSDAVQRVTGVAPRMIEPWSPTDTGVWDSTFSYWDVDTAQNPFQWADGSLRYTGFMIVYLPASAQQSQLLPYPVLTFDDSWYWDIPGSSYFDLPAVSVTTSIYDLITSLHAEGTVIYVKFQLAPT